ncbi:MAG: hypothetical protein ACRDPY_33625 [Streptosporangiaceae bacterium]
MPFLTTPPGYKAADSITIALATAGAVLVIYGSKVGPVADVHSSMPGDPNIGASITKAGWEAMVLVAAMTLLTKDLNVAILGFGAVALEHTMHLHAEMASPANGQIAANPAAYAAAGSTAAVLTAVG